MEEDQPSEIFQAPPEYQSRLSRQNSGGSGKRYLIIIIFIVVLVVIILGVFKFLRGGKNTDADIMPTPTSEIAPSDTPSPTPINGSPTPTGAVSTTPSPSTTPGASSSIDKATGLDRSKLAIHVLNGSGVSGASKKASDFLEGLGYNVVESGNAENFDYDNSEIQIKASDSKYLALLKKDASSKYTIGSTSATLKESGRDDAVFIVGKE
ncbi:MAG TPA: LytR C-terminal domain-containing protein [Patescibacteria group bacterium]|nr:LytR C-terminal domain-containing protein [Patescibacteria group bacterium]